MIEISFGYSHLADIVAKIRVLLSEGREGSPEMLRAFYELITIAPQELSRLFFDRLKGRLVFYTEDGKAVCSIQDIAWFLGVSEDELLGELETLGEAGKVLAIDADKLYRVN